MEYQVIDSNGNVTEFETIEKAIEFAHDHYMAVVMYMDLKTPQLECFCFRGIAFFIEEDCPEEVE